MDEQYRELRESLAAGPSPGPWSYDTWPNDPQYAQSESVYGPSVTISQTVNGTRFTKDMRYIAAANPKVVAELLAERDRLIALLDARNSPKEQP